MTKSAPAMPVGAAALAVAFSLAAGAAFAQEAPAGPPAPIAGIWGDAVSIEAASESDCFNKAADVGGGRISERTDVYGRQGGARWIAFEQDCGIRNRGLVNKPMYKPDLWERIRLLDYNGNVGAEWIEYSDPVWRNLPEGVPRMGPPSKIIYVDDAVRGPEVTFLWAERNTFKTIAADCREHDPVLAYDQSMLGHATGCWEDGSFIVHSKGFADSTWLHWSGWPHSNEMEVIERFTPNEDGSTMLYEVTVIDPVMFLEPWVKDPQLLERNTNPEAMILEDVPYVEHSLGVMALPRNRG